MNAMTFSGRRAEIVWGKGKRQYDAYLVKFGFFVPLLLGELLHIWDIPLTTFGTCKAIKLRPDAALKKRVLIADWTLMSGIGLLIGCPFLWSMVHFLPGIASLLLSLVLIAGGIVLMREGSRMRQIRLVLGTHAWGSSDPATWGKSIRKDVVDPKVVFRVKSYSALAKKAMAEEEWCKAMWAARLCAAVEDADTGEELTDDILAEEEVRDRLAQVQRSPGDHKREFGKAPPLRQWLKCDPSYHVVEIT